MSAAIFARLLEEFRQGWLDSRSQLFNIEVLSPGSFYRGWEPSELDTVNYDKQAVIGTVCLPYKLDAEGSTTAVVVMMKRDRESHTWLPSQETINEFEQLCAKAGTALPLAIRNRLARYHTWETERRPENWWLSVLVALHGFTVYNAEGQYQKQQLITNPWQASIDAIEYLRLNTDAPGWPEETSADAPPNSGESAAGNDSNGTPDLISFDSLRRRVGVSLKTFQNAVSDWRKAGHKINDPCSYAMIRPLLIVRWPKKIALFGDFDEVMRTVDAK